MCYFSARKIFFTELSISFCVDLDRGDTPTSGVLLSSQQQQQPLLHHNQQQQQQHLMELSHSPAPAPPSMPQQHKFRGATSSVGGFVASSPASSTSASLASAALDQMSLQHQHQMMMQQQQRQQQQHLMPSLGEEDGGFSSNPYFSPTAATRHLASSPAAVRVIENPSASVARDSVRSPPNLLPRSPRPPPRQQQTPSSPFAGPGGDRESMV